MTINPKLKYYAVSAVSLLVIFFSIYYLLGGTRDFYVEEKAAADYDIVGKPYKGEYSAESAQVLFEEIRDKVLSGEWEGDLVEITYPPEEGEDVNQFFGVLLTGAVTQIDGAYRLKKVTAPQVLTVRLTMHGLVRPSREKVEALISGYAQERGMSLEEYYLQRYLPDNSVEVEAFVRE